MTTAVAASVVGLLLGGVAAKGGICFNRGVRRAVFDRDPRVLRIFAVALGAQLLVLPLLLAAGVGALDRAVEAGQPGLVPVSQLVGGTVFGIGMALAGGCIMGVLWKSGAGSVATTIAIVGFAAGELLIRAYGDSALRDLDAVWQPADSSLAQLTGLPYELLAPLAGGAVLALVLARGRAGVGWGLALGAVAALAWVAADVAGYGYGLGFAGGAQATRDAIADGGQLPFQLFLGGGVVVGSAAVVHRRPRLPGAGRALGALAGGALMGAGATAAKACNIGHGVAGLSLLSLGSVVAIAAMAAGVAATSALLIAGKK